MSSASCHFRADLVELTHQHLQFLLLVHAEGVSVRRPSVESLRRYTKLWLPLVAKFSASQDEEEGNVDNIELIPPPDIAWLWHCHRLSPTHYAHHLRSCNLMQHENVTEKNNSRLARQCYLDANPPFGIQTEYSTETPIQLDTVHSMVVAVATIAKWVEAYPEEPFFLRSSPTAVDDTGTTEELDLDGDDVRLVSGYDLLASSKRQSTFLWQVKQAKFSDDAFLKEGVKNYHRFLRLYPKARGLHRLVPTYQIDIIWHTHMLSSLRQYDEECISIMGCAFGHDDSLNDRSEGSSLEVAFRATSTLWEREYGEKYHVEGGMYRGEPPSSFFCPNADGIRATLEQRRNRPATAHHQAYTVVAATASASNNGGGGDGGGGYQFSGGSIPHSRMSISQQREHSPISNQSPPRNPVPQRSETFTHYTNHAIRNYKSYSLFLGLLPIAVGAAMLAAGILRDIVVFIVFGPIIILMGAVRLSYTLLWIVGKLDLPDDVIIKKLFGRGGRGFGGFVGGGGCGGGGCGGGGCGG